MRTRNGLGYGEARTIQHSRHPGGGEAIVATARLRRVLAGVRSTSLTRPATGGYDRTHDGLVSGWFTCPACGTPSTPTPDLLVDGQPIAATKATTPRGDVPGGLGFLLRFTPTGTPNAHARVQCPTHRDQSLDLQVPAGTWATPALAAIETSTWPMVTGWLAHLSARDGDITLTIDGYHPIPVRTTIRRPDVQAYLGTPGVGGFQIDLGAMLGYALPDTTRTRLHADDTVLADATITDSPLGDDAAGCLTASGGTTLDEDEIHALRRRLRDTEVETSSNDWRDILDRLGQREFTAETEQWADYLTHHGQTPQQIAAWLALRATHALGVAALNPLPATLDVGIELDERLPDRVRTWTEPILGIHDRPTSHNDAANHQASPSATDLSDMKVAVAGLVHHRSGLGQNAQNSLAALDLAGIHACPAPFFPAPGGWNPRLGPSREAIGSLEDHTILLHLPIDKVIPSLAAQPALLRTDRLIGYFMWELETVPKQFHRALDLVDEIWTATDFVANAFRDVTDTPVQVTGHAVDVSCVEEVTRAELDIAEDAFVVHFAFDANSTVARKNPNAALDAFHLAFGDDPTAVFVLKIRNFQQIESLVRQGDRHARGLLTRLLSMSNVILITSEWPYARSIGLIAMADCYLSLHRSEGFGYGIAEARALGVPTLITAYSGPTELSSTANDVLVPCTPTYLEPGDYFYWSADSEWADATHDPAARALQQIRLESGRLAGNSRNVDSLAELASQYASRLGDSGFRLSTMKGSRL